MLHVPLSLLRLSYFLLVVIHSFSPLSLSVRMCVQKAAPGQRLMSTGMSAGLQADPTPAEAARVEQQLKMQEARREQAEKSKLARCVFVCVRWVWGVRKMEVRRRAAAHVWSRSFVLVCVGCECDLVWA